MESKAIKWNVLDPAELVTQRRFRKKPVELRERRSLESKRVADRLTAAMMVGDFMREVATGSETSAEKEKYLP